MPDKLPERSAWISHTFNDVRRSVRYIGELAVQTAYKEPMPADEDHPWRWSVRGYPDNVREVLAEGWAASHDHALTHCDKAWLEVHGG